MDACKLHSNVDCEHGDTQRPVRGHCAFCEDVRGGGRVPRIRMCAGVIIRSRFFFPRKPCLRDIPWLRGTMIRDQHEYNPPSVPSSFILCLSSSSLCGCYAKRYPHSALAKPCASYNVIVADTVTVVNTFQSPGARTADVLHDSQSTAWSSRGCCGPGFVSGRKRPDHYSFMRDADSTYLWLTVSGITRGISSKKVGQVYKHIRGKDCIQTWQLHDNADKVRFK